MSTCSPQKFCVPASSHGEVRKGVYSQGYNMSSFKSLPHAGLAAASDQLIASMLCPVSGAFWRLHNAPFCAI